MESNDTSAGQHFFDVSLRRRQIFERTRAKYAAAGIALDDPEYLDLIARWIEGEITMPEAAARWDKMRSLKHNKAVPVSSTFDDIDLANLPKMSQEELLAEIAKLAD